MKLAPRLIKPKFNVVGSYKELHYVSGKLHKVRKDVRKARELLTKPAYEGVKVREVEIKILQRIDHSRYTGEKLRAIRAERGVGRPCRK